jgi:MoxR-like ATPase
VLATQNPIETEGTYQLPEAQVDRFLLKVLVDYPNEREEYTIVQRMTGALPQPRPIISTDYLVQLQRHADAVYVDPVLIEYAVRVVAATRKSSDYGLGELARYLTFGGSPRASINLVLAARALAMLRGRDHVLPSDIAELVPDVLRHRLVLSYEALADSVTADALIARLLERVPAPSRPLADAPAAPSQQPRLRYEQSA